MHDFIVFPDAPSGGSTGDVLAVDMKPPSVRLRVNEFVTMECRDGRRFLGQVTGPNRNLLKLHSDPLSPICIESMQRHLIGQNDAAFDSELHAYVVRLLFLIESDGGVQVANCRPRTGARVRRSTVDEINTVLGLGALSEEAVPLGSLMHVPEVGIALNEKILRHHILCAGATGSGKTNVLAEAARWAALRNVAVFIFDHKPDYSLFADSPELDAAMYRLGKEEYRFDDGSRLMEQSLSAPASAFPLEMLAGTVFHRPGEHNMAEACAELLTLYGDSSSQDSWSLNDFRDWLVDKEGELTKNLVHKQTYKAVMNKCAREQRRPPFVDGSRGVLGIGSGGIDIGSMLRPGKVNVIRVAEDVKDSRGYGLFVSYLLSQQYKARSRGISCPVLNVIDEAQDIFNAPRQLRDAAVAEMSTQIRKGRSRNICFVIAVQSSKSVPQEIMNNLNSRIIMRHNSDDEARCGALSASREQLAMAENFGPGEALVNLFGWRVTVHAKLNETCLPLVRSSETWAA